MNIFSVSAEVQDVEVLLNNVQEVVTSWEGGATPALDLTTMLGQSNTLQQQVSQLRAQANIDSTAIVQSNRPGLGPLIIRFQQMMRRLTWWFTEPLMHQIRMFQINLTMTLGQFAQNQQGILQNAELTRQETARLEARIATLEKQVARLQERRESDAGDRSEPTNGHG